MVLSYFSKHHLKIPLPKFIAEPYLWALLTEARTKEGFQPKIQGRISEKMLIFVDRKPAISPCKVLRVNHRSRRQKFKCYVYCFHPHTGKTSTSQLPCLIMFEVNDNAEKNNFAACSRAYDHDSIPIATWLRFRYYTTAGVSNCYNTPWWLGCHLCASPSTSNKQNQWRSWH